ncbi:hypothetical protein K432DRAFT_387092 [Lepidopterella palustris CBS 459.81]|uniref:DUF7730 domain-containing protein n=1 Tax=Lepidopterella palustris CBS 459.81 TaxID=1314670 RepID=A0A8E2DY71_9PEZI|nr:hypothetical protein K432DRAFT_387092 [Lepidopterella palustris CBS 459.81]
MHRGEGKSKRHPLRRLQLDRNKITRPSLSPLSPTGIPKIRHALSLTSSPEAEPQRTAYQFSSLFFQKLPLELRRMVYAEALGGKVVHFTSLPRRRLGHFLCREAGQGRGTKREGGWGCACRINDSRVYKRMDGMVLALLLTCRQAYSESIEFLYTHTTFSILYTPHLLHLSLLLPAPRLSSIRTLCIRWHIRGLPYYTRPGRPGVAFPEDTAHWQRLWQIIANLQGLRDLYVVLVDINWKEQWLALEKTLLEPVKLVVRPERFELVLPWEESDVGIDVGASACRLRRPPRVMDEEEGEDW